MIGHDGNGTIIFLNLTDARHVRVGADVWGNLYETEPIPVDYNRIQDLVVSASALYPPDDPLVAALDPATALQLRGELRVDLNGAKVLEVSHPPNKGETTDVRLGENLIGGSFAGPRFSGEIIASSRLPLSQWLQLGPGEVVRVRLKLPQATASGREPLLTLAGDGRMAVAYVFPNSPNSARLGIFSFDGTWAELPVDTRGALALEIRAGRADSSPFPSALSIDLDGRHLLGPAKMRPLLDPLQVVTGRNLVESAAVNADFDGRELSAEIVRETAAPRRFGPVDLVVAFPRDRAGRPEPLVVSGRRGAADLIYVVYADAHHVRFGVDHWGQGGATSGLVPLDYAARHELEVSLGSLYPAEGDRWWEGMSAAARQELASRVRIRLDGRTVLDAPVTAYPSSSDRIVVGANRIGASTCDAQFSGQIFFSGRLSLSDPAAAGR